MKVISNARKLIFRPALGAPIVSFPEGAVMSPYGADNDAPTIVVQNATCKDKSWQGVSHDKGAVLVNGVPGDVADAALRQYDAGGQTIDALNQVLADLASQGYNDQYTTSIDFIENKLSPAGLMMSLYTGLVKRNDRDQIECWRSGGEFFTAPNGEARVIEPEILVRDYRLPDGATIDLSLIREGVPEGVAA
jgi:hypothetical protein